MSEFTVELVRYELIPTIQSRVDAFNERLRKRDIPGSVSVSFTNDRMVEISGPIRERVTDVTVSYPRLVTEDGWEFVAALDHIGGKVVVRPMEGQTVPPFAYDVEPGRCDHCRQDRRRNTSYLIRRGDDNFKVIGSSCVDDFMGHSASSILRFGGEFRNLLDEDERVPRQKFIDTDEVIDIASKVVAVSGRYVKSSEPGSTIDDVRMLLFASASVDARDFFTTFHSDARFAEQAERIASETRIGISELNDDSEWSLNIRTLDDIGFLNIEKHLSIFASSVTIGLRRVRSTEERKAKRNEWLGSQGEKVTIDATVTGGRIIESNWGTSILYTFTTEAGELAKWFSSRDLDLSEGDAVRVTGTIKALDEYNGRKSTNLTRCKVVNIAS
jgi:hypothetical protein